MVHQGGGDGHSPASRCESWTSGTASICRESTELFRRQRDPKAGRITTEEGLDEILTPSVAGRVVRREERHGEATSFPQPIRVFRGAIILEV